MVCLTRSREGDRGQWAALGKKLGKHFLIATAAFFFHDDHCEWLWQFDADMNMSRASQRECDARYALWDAAWGMRCLTTPLQGFVVRLHSNCKSRALISMGYMTSVFVVQLLGV